MIKIYSKIKTVCLVLALSLTGGCNTWLDIDPEGVQTSDTFWQTKEEVEQVLVSTYLQLRDCFPLFLKWGELRGDGIDFGPAHASATDGVTADERLVKQMDIRPTNSLARWEDVYTAIGYANSVIWFTPMALKNDVTFAPELANSYVAEAIFLRSLCYFYLVRTFRDVPMVLTPYADDSKDFAIEKTDEAVILEQLIKDLEAYKVRCKPGYEQAWQSKGRATSWAFQALLADIYLWRGAEGDYDKVLEIARVFEKSNLQLMPNKEWMSIYYPGNSKESIFELQYNHSIGQKNALYDWFWGKLESRYVVSAQTRELFESESQREPDVRGYGSGYGDDSEGRIWKYAGTKNTVDKFKEIRPESERAANWIFYRYADILLMKAEALAMKNELKAACSVMDETVRLRAGYSIKMDVPESKRTMLELIMAERQREFLGEGKRWFDILRMAKRENYENSDYLVEVVLLGVPSKQRQLCKSKLEQSGSHYLPIHLDDIKASKGTLVQNSFYINVE